MQTTLLGLAITFIIALIAALIGPHFIDWNQFRPQFEAEASRVLGTSVRVEGLLDARLLPSPSLRLGSVVVGGANDAGRVRADHLDIEFSLGSLMRGEWRATELTINGIALDLGLDTRGQIDWPLSSRSLNFGSLSIDRLNLTGRVALHDAASRSTLELSDIAFGGDVRSSPASVRGDGNFMLSGTRYPFQISSGQSQDGKGARLHFTVASASRSPSVDLDGVLAFGARVPHFDGALTLAGPVATDGTSQRPWRMSAMVKADPTAARLEKIEASYGAEDAALKLLGSGDIQFGESPHIHAVLSAHQLDVDRLFAKEKDKSVPISAMLHDFVTSIPKPSLATRIEISAEQITLGERPLQDLSADLQSDRASWKIDRLEFQAPGATRVNLSGRIAQPGPSARFDGTLAVESSNPDTFVGWLQGRSEAIYRSKKPLRARGNLSIDSNQVTLDQLEADIEGESVAGRLSIANATAGKGSRAEVVLTADRLDLDAAGALVRALAGPESNWPEEGRFSLDVTNAMSAGQELSPFVARLTYGLKAISLEQLKIGRPGGLAMEGAGAFDRVNATGHLSLSASSDSLAQITSLIAPVAPEIAARLNAMPDAQEAARLNLALRIDKDPADKNKADAHAKLEIDLPRLKGTISMAAAPALSTIRGMDIGAFARSEVTLQAKLSADRGGALLALLGLDKIAEAGNGPMLFDGTATGNWHAPIRLMVGISGADLDAEMKGTAEPWASERKADINLTVRRVNFAPMLNLKPSDPRGQNFSLSSHVTLAGSKLTFNNFDGTAAGARMRGRVSLDLGNENAVDGEIGMDSIDLASVLSLSVGALGHDAAEPLSRGLLGGWRGQLTFGALRGALPGGIELRSLSGVLKGDAASLTFDSIKGKIGDGDATARIAATQTTDGVALNAEVKIKSADGSALHYGMLAMPAGRVSVQMTLASQGRSASALVGALSGSGLVTIDGAQIPGLNPRAFDVAIHSSDGGQAVDDTRLQQIVGQALSAAPLPVASVQVPFNVNDGRLRVGATTLVGEGARAIISGGYDIAANQVDIRANLGSTSAGSANDRPEIQIFTVGSANAIDRSVDVGALSSWLAVRAIDRETRRLDAIEQGSAPAPAPSPGARPPTAASLPVEAPAISAVPPVSPPPAGVPVPNRDPRRSPSKPHATPQPPLSTVPQAPTTPLGPQAAPLPAPILIRPAPAPKPVRPRQPLVLTPPASAGPRSAF